MTRQERGLRVPPGEVNGWRGIRRCPSNPLMMKPLSAPRNPAGRIGPIRSDCALHRLLLPSALDGRGNTQALAIFRDRPTRDVDIGRTQLRDDRVVGEDVLHSLALDHDLDLVANRFSRVRLTAALRRDRGGEEIFELE